MLIFLTILLRHNYYAASMAFALMAALSLQPKEKVNLEEDLNRMRNYYPEPTADFTPHSLHG